MFSLFGLLLQFLHSTFALGRFRRIPGRITRFLVDRRRRADAYRDLQSLDQYMLRDIGLSHRAASEWRSQRHDRP
jgi:hypothetical protein